MWVCGPEPVLREEVIAAARAAAPEVVSLRPGEHSEADIWSVCAEYGGSRQVVIRSADKLRHWDQFGRIMDNWRQVENTRILFAAAQPDFPRTDGELASQCARIRDSASGQLICCTAPTGDALADWVGSRLPAGGRVLGLHVIDAVGQEKPALAELAAVAVKLRLLGIASEQAVRAVASEVSGETFADALVLRGRKAALAHRYVSHGEIGGEIGKLDYLTGILNSLHDARERKLGAADVRRRYGIGSFVLRRYGDVAPSYTPARIAGCRQVLAMADGHWRRGADEGILEAIAALW